MKTAITSLCLILLVLCSSALAQTPAVSWPEETIDTWQGYKRHHFTIDGCHAWVVEPKEALPGKPWSWCMEFPDAFTERCAAPALLEKGFHHAHISVGNTFGSPAAVKHLCAFYDALRQKGFAEKAVLIGISRGGLYAYRFAAENPSKVSVIYGDAPVCDFKSWPGGKGKGQGGAGDWAELIKCYGFKDEAEALAYQGNPIDVLKTLAEAKIALIHVVGDADDVVPPNENTAIVEERYKKLGGQIEVIHKPGVGHHPHGLEDPAPVVKFILKHSVGELPGLRKIGDFPLRDTSLCRGPDGMWYLTGTCEPFWGYNEGIKIWKSKDMAAWEPLGMVWRYGASPWHKKYLEAKKPLWAPEIHYLKDTFWLTYSIPGWDGTGKTSGSGLLRSTTGKAEGPYEDVQPNERMGDEIDASLFQDDDGAVYFLWHSGKIAKMKPDMSGLAEPYHWLKTTGKDPNPQHHSGLCAGIFGPDSFDHVGFEGMFLFKANGRYYLACSDLCDGSYSCYIAESKEIFGPYGDRYEAIPHGGHNMFYKDAEGQWWSTYFGSDGQAPWCERPGVLPIRFDDAGHVRMK